MSWLSKILGTDTGDEDRRAEEYVRQGTDAFSNLDIPELQNPELSGYEDVGGYDPSLVTAPDLQDPERVTFEGVNPRFSDFSAQKDSGYGDISTDPRLQNEQYDSLAALDELIQGGGMNAQDRANLNRIQSDAAQADRGRRDAILQNMGARGMGGGGMELLAQLQSSQAATDRANQSGLDVAGMAQQRALDAIMQSGQLAGSMRSQDFGEQAERARAQDAINQFNTGNRLQNNQWNAGQANNMGQFNASSGLQNAQFNSGMGFDASKARANMGMQSGLANQGAINQANQYKVANTQDIANRNTGVKNDQAVRGQATAQQNINNDLAKAQGVSGSAQAGTGFYTAKGDRKSRIESDVLGGIIKGSIAAAI